MKTLFTIFFLQLIHLSFADRVSYTNSSGNIVWQQQSDTTKALRLLNIDFMLRGYFYAYSTPKNTEADQGGGWAISSNKPNKITDHRFKSNSLAITIDSSIIDAFENDFLGFKLFISNTTTDAISFNAQDSRLYMTLQAQNNKGEWKDIEYLPSSWCGNSYHTLELEPNAYWSFTIPKYHGKFQTKIRAVLKDFDRVNQRIVKVVYSNTINCSINPGQFSNKREYNPKGLMDPYND